VAYDGPIHSFIDQAHKDKYDRLFEAQTKTMKSRDSIPIAEFDNGVMLHSGPGHYYTLTGHMPDESDIWAVWEPIIQHYPLADYRREDRLPFVGVKTWFI
jgi:hypothetical protein